jgi:uncharacterized protein YybS (DUF2232 family)
MIVTTIVNIFYDIINFIMSPFPSIPHIPQTIMDTANAVVTSVASSVQVVSFVLSPALIAIIFVVTLAVLNFHWIYVLFMWAIKKIPMVNLK